MITVQKFVVSAILLSVVFCLWVLPVRSHMRVTPYDKVKIELSAGAIGLLIKAQPIPGFCKISILCCGFARDYRRGHRELVRGSGKFSAPRDWNIDLCIENMESTDTSGLVAM